MNETKRTFKKGDFITNTNKPGSFAIFEGIERESYTTSKKFSVIVYYDPNKYCENQNGSGWDYQKFLEVATTKTRCDQTVDGEESYWWKLCTEEEIEKAIQVLWDYGYCWNEKLLCIVNRETGEVVRPITEPNLKYNGETVRPISKRLKDLLIGACKKMIEKKYSYSSNYYQVCYGGFWDGECWD